MIDKENKRAYDKRYRAAHPQKRAEQNRRYRAIHRKELNDNRAQARAEQRHAVIMAYGGYQCACPGCDVTEPEYLGLDHINGGGYQDRKEHGGSGDGFYRWLRSQNYPAGIRVMCHNCNLARGVYGKCPHERKDHHTNNGLVLQLAQALNDIMQNFENRYDYNEVGAHIDNNLLLYSKALDAARKAGVI